MLVAYKPDEEAKVVELNSKTNDRKAINSRRSPRNLKRVLDSLNTLQQKRLKQIGFGEFKGNFDFYSMPAILGLWVVKNFNPQTCTLVMEDGSMIKITRELIHDMLGIPMGDIKVKSLKEKNLFDPVTSKWRGMVQEIVNHDNKINISQLETFLCTLSEADLLFDIGFLSLFFSIFGQGNKDESLVKECTSFSASDKFSGPLLLLVRNELFVTLYRDNEELRNSIDKRNELFVTLYKDENKKVEEDDEDIDRDLEKDDYDEETDGDNDDDYDAPDGDNDDIDKDDAYDNDKNDENIRNEKEKKNVDEGNKEEVGSDNVKYDNMEEGIIVGEQKDENMEKEKEKKNLQDDTTWDKSKVIVLFVDYNDYEINDTQSSNETGVTHVIDKANVAGASNAVDKIFKRRRRLQVFDDVSILNTQLESKKIHDPSLVVHQMIEDMTKLPLIFGALKEAAHDVPSIDARPSFNKLMFKLKRDSDGTVHVKKINDVPGSLEKGSVKAVEVPYQKVINAGKDKTVKVIKKEVPKNINAKVAVKRSVKAVEVPPDKIVDPVKKKVAAMTQFKQARPTTKIIKNDYQMPKRGRKKVAQVLEEDLVVSGKCMVFFPCVKLSEEETSNHYYLICFNMMTIEIDIIDNIYNDLEDLDLRYGPHAMALGKRLKVFIEEKGKEDKADEDVPDIKKGRSTSTSISIESIDDHNGAKKKFFVEKKEKIKVTKKDLRKKGKMVVPVHEDEELTNEDDREYFKSKIFRKVILEKALSENEKKLAEFIWRACNDGSEVAAGILDIWSLVLNHEGKYREKNSSGGNIYCYSGMLVFFPMITTKRSHHFYLICFNLKTTEIDIIDNLNNDIEDISVRYGYEGLLSDNLSKIKALLLDTDDKIKIALDENPEDIDLKMTLEKRLAFFKELNHRNKYGTVNDRIIPFFPNTGDVSQMDWCSYALECMVRGCKEYKLGKYFSGPLLLISIIYVNSTVSETVKVEKTVLAFKAWNSKLLLKREQEEIVLGGFGRLPIVEDLQVIETKKKKTFKKKNLIENKSIIEDVDATKDVVDKNEDFNH
nr:ulp1 protease family, C-terminal catalytic domain-containing protein [Tanacetum cinerariifolium]